MRHSDKESDDAGFGEFVAANTARLVHLAELLTGSPHDAPDLVQSALIKVPAGMLGSPGLVVYDATGKALAQHADMETPIPTKSGNGE